VLLPRATGRHFHQGYGRNLRNRPQCWIGRSEPLTACIPTEVRAQTDPARMCFCGFGLRHSHSSVEGPTSKAPACWWDALTTLFRESQRPDLEKSRSPSQVNDKRWNSNHGTRLPQLNQHVPYSGLTTRFSLDGPNWRVGGQGISDASKS
jgi:hypothetical protein